MIQWKVYETLCGMEIKSSGLIFQTLCLLPKSELFAAQHNWETQQIRYG